MRKLTLAALLPAALLILDGCAGLSELARGAVKEPKLTFRSASIESVDMEGATVAFTWDLENPNGFGVDLARVGWSVEVESTRIASGELPGGLKIPAAGRAPVVFPVRVRYRDVPGIVGLLTSGKDQLRYRLAGTLGVRTPLGVLDLPMSHDDQLRLPGIPRFAVEGLAIRNVSFTEVGLDLRVRVKNPNPFALPAGQLDYTLAIAGAQVARGAGAGLAAVAGGSSAVVEIPIRIDLASAGRAATELVRGGEVQVDLAGKAGVAGIPLPLEYRGRVPARR